MHIANGGGPQKRQPKPEPGFTKLDKNSDGKLDAEELKASKKFASFDQDGDGSVTRDEALVGAKAKAAEDRLKKALAKYDTNEDGLLSGNEIKPEMKGFDKDGDGRVTTDEFKAGRREQRKQELNDKFEKAFAKLDSNEDGELSGNEAEKHKAFDKDGDGRISKEEFLAGKMDAHKEAIAEDKAATEAELDERLEKLWERRDTNEDGWLSGNEVTEFRQQFDRDGNGEVTKQEFIEGKKELRRLREEARLLGDDPREVRLQPNPPQPEPDPAG